MPEVNMIASNKDNTAGVVVLYHPEENVIANITSYLPEVAVLYCIDNSDTKVPALVEQLIREPKIHYLDNQGNQGLAAALNTGAFLALENGYQWLLTMDQDSKAHPDMLSFMRKALLEYDDLNVAIVAPFQQDKDNQHQAREENVIEVQAVMTSGNLLNLAACSHVGPFRSDLFIDYIDYEYCLRLKLNGYKILQVPKAILFHSVGEITLNYLLGLRITASNHGPLRRYYITRNRLKVMSMYRKHFPEFAKQDTYDMLKDVLRISLFEKDKLKKLRYMGYGLRDFHKNIFGKFRKKNL